MNTAAALPTNPPLNREVEAQVKAVMLSPRKQTFFGLSPNCFNPLIPNTAAMNSAVFWYEASDSKRKLEMSTDPPPTRTSPLSDLS